MTQEFYGITSCCNMFFDGTLASRQGTRFQERKACRGPKKFPRGLLAERNPVRPVALASLHGRRTFSCSHYCSCGAHGRPEKERILVAQWAICTHNLVWTGVSPILFICIILSDPASLGPFRAGEQSRTVCHGRVCGVRRPDGGGATKFQFNLIRSSVEPLAGKWRTQPNCFLSLFPHL